MVSTIPAQQAELLNKFPALADYARTAVRLHPRPGSPKAAESSIGGPLLWPIDEPWPMCTEPHIGRRVVAQAGQPGREQREAAVTNRARELEALEALGSAVPDGVLRAARSALARAEAERNEPHSAVVHEAAQTAEPVVMVPILQVFRRDIPGLAFSGDNDLCQLLWCPERHVPGGAPRPVIFWRRAADVIVSLAAAPEPNRFYRENYIPNPCVMHPESVLEYPPICTLSIDAPDYRPLGILPPSLESRIRLWSAGQPERYGYPSIAHAPGWKVRGWENSGPDSTHLTACECGRPMDVLIDAYRSEDLGGPWTPTGDVEFVWGDPDNWEDQEPTRVDISRDGAFWIRVCSFSAEHKPSIGIS